MGLQGARRQTVNRDQTAATVGLGLAVLAGLCRVQKVAASSAVVEKAPLLLKVCSSMQLHHLLNGDQYMLAANMFSMVVGTCVACSRCRA